MYGRKWNEVLRDTNRWFNESNVRWRRSRQSWRFAENLFPHFSYKFFTYKNIPAITYESLTNQLTKHGGLLENLSISIDRWLVPNNPETSHAKHRMNLPHQLSAPYIKNNSVYLVFVTLFVSFNLFLFITRGIKFWFKTRSFLVVIARACGKPQFIYF